MKKRRALLIAMGMLIALSLWAPVQAAQVWTTPQKITSAGAIASRPVVYGDKVYFNDRRSGLNQIYVWDQAGGAQLYMGGPVQTMVSAVYGDKMVFSRYENSHYSLYLHAPGTGDRLISGTVGSSAGAGLYGDMVTWVDTRSGVKQVYTWDPVSGERRLNPTAYTQDNPRIWGNKVVYEDYRYVEDPRYQGADPDIWTWDPLSGSQQLALGMRRPLIYQDDIYAFKPGSGGLPPYTQSQLYRFGPRGGLLLTGTYATCDAAWGDFVLNWGGGVHSWDPVHGVVQISPTGTNVSLWGRQAAWVNNNDIYTSSLVPEPSSLCAVALLLAGTCTSLACRRRRRA